jgi:DHA1 family inner membrane transport protein
MPIALLALTAGAFGIGTTEFVIMGLLMQVSADLRSSIASAGLLISGYALGVAVGAPVLTIATRKLPRKTVLLALMAIFTLGNLACALAPNYEMLMAARVITSLAHGTFFGVGSVVATGLVAPERRASAIAIMFTGLTAATLLGVPAGAWLGLHFGWRSTFWAVTLIGLLALSWCSPCSCRAEGRGQRQRAAARRTGRAGPPAGAAGPGDDGARLCRRVRGVHLHPAAADAAHGASGIGGVAHPAGVRRRHGRRQHPGRQAGRPRADAAAARHAGRAGLVLGAMQFTMQSPFAAVVFVGLLGVASFATVAPMQLRVLRKGLGRGPEPGVQPEHRGLQPGQRAGRVGRRPGHQPRAGAGALGWVAALLTLVGLAIALWSRALDRREPARGLCGDSVGGPDPVGFHSPAFGRAYWPSGAGSASAPSSFSGSLGTPADRKNSKRLRPAALAL